MERSISLEPGFALPDWARFCLYPHEHKVDLSPADGQEKWIVLTVPTRSHISLLIALGIIREKLGSSSCHHRNYGISEISDLAAGEEITWLDMDRKFLNYGRVVDSNYGRSGYLRYEFQSENKNSSIVSRDKEMAVKFRFDRYFGEKAKDPRPLAEPSPGAESLYGLSNLDLQCRSANYVHTVGVLSKLKTESQSNIYVDDHSTSLENLLRPDYLFPTGHYLSRWSPVGEEDESIIENSEITIFDGASAFFRNRDVCSPVNVVIVDRWENRAFGVVEELVNFAAMYGGLSKSSATGIAIEIATFTRSR